MGLTFYSSHLIYMKLLAFLLIFYTQGAFAYFCMGNPKVVSVDEFSRQVIQMPANGIVKVDLGTQPGQLTEIYRGKGIPFRGLNFSLEKNEDVDDRSAFWKWIKPKKLNPTTYAMIISLRDPYIKDILGISAASIDVTVRATLDNGRPIQGDIVFNSYLSANCQP